MASLSFQSSLVEAVDDTNASSDMNYRDIIAQRLSGLVQIPSITYDGMGHVGEDTRWDVFYDIPPFLKRVFPKVHQTLKLKKINKHALLYTWQGSDAFLKPLLFMAHTDVVPVSSDTLGRWTYPPFSGHYDGKFIWGRGSEDDKSNLIAILSAFESLLEVGFVPSRTIIFAIGFDEEGGAEQSYGAGYLSAHLLKVYAEDGIELILDEGVNGITEYFGTDFATPASAEKGYVDVSITVDTPGGHSSTPPDHTAIGYLAQIIQAIEAHPFKSTLSDKNPTKSFLKLAAKYAKDMPKEFRKAILDPGSEAKVLKYMDSSRETRSLVRTSTAVDVISGGEKSNALPEQATVLINHRIAVEESVHKVKEYYINLLSPFVKDWSFQLHGFGEADSLSSHETSNTITLRSAYDLEPSPVSCPEDVRFTWLSDTIKQVFGPDIIVSPVLLAGNTDTKFYWKLSDQIYRWSPWRGKLDPRGSRMHTVDERMPVEGLMDMVRFYERFVRVVDERRRGGVEVEGWVIV